MSVATFAASAGALVAKAEAARNGRSLVEYVLAKRREACAVCALPADIRAQIGVARERKIERRVIRAWLLAEHGADIPDSIFTSHSAAHHEERE